MADQDLFSDVEVKIKKKNRVLFSRESACLQELLRLIEVQKHRTLVLWALDCAKIPLEKLAEHCPSESRPRTALEICRSWARGDVKMPIARKAILDSHAAAKDMDNPADAALCHAIGHAGATVHVETHAIGLPFYELTALVMESGYHNYQKAVIEKIKFYQQRLVFWQENIDKTDFNWAKFLLDDSPPNKERQLREKQRR